MSNEYEQELKLLRKSLCKALALKNASDDAIVSAIEQLQGKQKEIEEKQKALSAALQAEREAADKREIEEVLSTGTIEKDEVARYKALLPQEKWHKRCCKPSRRSTQHCKKKKAPAKVADRSTWQRCSC